MSSARVLPPHTRLAATKAGGPGCAFLGNEPLAISATTTTSTFGTFGQYSLGFASQVAGTGWLSFARVDYRNGPNLQGLSGTGGIRYQFTPEAIAQTRMPTKGPAIPIVTAVNWTGFYVGAFGGGVLGTADWNFAGGSASPHVGGYLWGGDIGYNYQFGQWVLGVEADFGKTNLNGGTACAPLLSGSNSDGNAAPMFQMTCNAWANWIATATARLGYSWGRTLYYVKGGGAWTNEQFSATCNLGPLNGNPYSQPTVHEPCRCVVEWLHRQQQPGRLDRRLRHRIRSHAQLVRQGRVQLHQLRRSQRDGFGRQPPQCRHARF